MGDEATQWHPGEAVEQRQDCLPDRAANVFEINVDAARTGAKKDRNGRLVNREGHGTPLSYGHVRNRRELAA
jgi:hypothetical protein